MIRTIIAIFMALFVSVLAQGQEIYVPPVNFPITLAGNFGEVRNDHFHGGIDIHATKGVGSPITAVMSGYVSRIGMSPFGYGYFLSIAHKNGYTTLYAHLDGFAKKIQQYIESEQIRRHSYAVDLYPPKEMFPVVSGDLIAFMGNTGASAGPHLHFEVRNPSQCPVNPLTITHFAVRDDIAPRLYKVMLYTCDTISGVPIFKNVQTLECDVNGAVDQQLRIAGPSYVAYEFIDYKNGVSNTMGITSLTQKIDGMINFGFTIDKISFATTKSINALVQYDKNLQNRNHVIRAYYPPNTQLAIYRNVVDQGLIRPERIGEKSALEAELIDDAGNKTIVKIGLAKTTKAPNNGLIEVIDKSLFWNRVTQVAVDNMRVTIPTGALYESTIVPFCKRDSDFIIGDPNVPLKNKISVSIVQNIPQNIAAKTALYLRTKSGGLSYVGGDYTAGKLTASLSSFGRYVIATDTVQPQIRSLDKSANLSLQSYVKFKISDTMSGISKYYIYIDDKWCIPMYDYRSSTLKAKITPKTPAVKHNVRVQVIDKEGNTSTAQYEFTW